MEIAIIILSAAFLASLYCAFFFLLSYNEEKEYARNLREKLQEIPALKKQIASSKQKANELQRNLEIEKQLRFVMQKRYVKATKEQKRCSTNQEY